MTAKELRQTTIGKTKLINTPLPNLLGMAHDQLLSRFGAGSFNFDDDEGFLDWLPWLQTGRETAKAFYYAISELRILVGFHTEEQAILLAAPV
jgi:hypothetical protein